MASNYDDLIVQYDKLNARQQERYNFQKVSSVLADYGFVTTWLSDDWKGADFLACHNDGEKILRVQLKGRFSFHRKYRGKGIYVAFRQGNQWYLYPHDELLGEVLAISTVGKTESWTNKGVYHYPKISKQMLRLLEPYRIGKADAAA